MQQNQKHGALWCRGDATAAEAYTDEGTLVREGTLKSLY